MFGFFNHGLGPMANFEASYRAYPVSFIDKLDAENGDKVFLPPSALDRLCETTSSLVRQCCGMLRGAGGSICLPTRMPAYVSGLESCAAPQMSV